MKETNMVQLNLISATDPFKQCLQRHMVLDVTFGKLTILFDATLSYVECIYIKCISTAFTELMWPEKKSIRSDKKLHYIQYQCCVLLRMGVALVDPLHIFHIRPRHGNVYEVDIWDIQSHRCHKKEFCKYRWLSQGPILYNWARSLPTNEL